MTDAIITLEDLKDYQAEWKEPVKSRLNSLGLNVYSNPPPGGGAICQFILNILEGGQ